MTKNEVNGRVAEAVELLRRAQPGRNAAEVRQELRSEASRILTSISRRDMRKVDDDLAAVLVQYV